MSKVFFFAIKKSKEREGRSERKGDTEEKMGGMRERKQVEGKHRGVHKHADTPGCTRLVIQVGKVADKSPHVCSAAGAN